jgi:hypothetical protein
LSFERWPAAPAAVVVVALCGVAALATWLASAPAEVERWMGESGPVERVTAATYAACALAAWLLHRRGDPWPSTLALSVVMAGFCMRELGWHRAFTGTSVLRVSWYLGPAPPAAKTVAALAVLAFALALGWLVWRHAPGLWRGWRQRRPAAVTVVVFIATLVVDKTLDRSVGLLVDAGIDVPLQAKALRTAFEEWFELALSALVVLGLVQHRAGA